LWFISWIKFGGSEVVKKKKQNGDGYIVCCSSDVCKPN